MSLIVRKIPRICSDLTTENVEDAIGLGIPVPQKDARDVWDQKRGFVLVNLRSLLVRSPVAFVHPQKNHQAYHRLNFVLGKQMNLGGLRMKMEYQGVAGGYRGNILPTDARFLLLPGF